MGTPEMVWRAAATTQMASDSIRTTVFGSRWDRRKLLRALASHGELAQARAALAAERWNDAHRALTAHFADTRTPIPDVDVLAFALRLPADQISARVTRRVDEQFDRGLLDEIRTLLARGIPESARPFGGLVYRQALEHLHGVRDERATRALIAQENRRYARRQLIWFRKEPNLVWLDGPGESPATIAAACRAIDDRKSEI